MTHFWSLFCKRSLSFFKQKRTEPLSEFPLWHVILKEPKSRHSGFIFVTVLSENSFLILLIEKKIKLNYKRNLFICCLSFMRSLHHKSLSEFDCFTHYFRIFSFDCCLFHFYKSSLSLQLKVANVIQIKKNQVLLELHNRSRKIILIC